MAFGISRQALAFWMRFDAIKSTRSMCYAIFSWPDLKLLCETSWKLRARRSLMLVSTFQAHTRFVSGGFFFDGLRLSRHRLLNWRWGTRTKTRMFGSCSQQHTECFATERHEKDCHLSYLLAHFIRPQVAPRVTLSKRELIAFHQSGRPGQESEQLELGQLTGTHFDVG